MKEDDASHIFNAIAAELGLQHVTVRPEHAEKARVYLDKIAALRAEVERLEKINAGLVKDFNGMLQDNARLQGQYTEACEAFGKRAERLREQRDSNVGASPAQVYRDLRARIAGWRGLSTHFWTATMTRFYAAPWRPTMLDPEKVASTVKWRQIGKRQERVELTRAGMLAALREVLNDTRRMPIVDLETALKAKIAALEKGEGDGK